jgi:hypothetical protein
MDAERSGRIPCCCEGQISFHFGLPAVSLRRGAIFGRDSPERRDVVRFQVISERCCSDNVRSIRGCFPMLCQTSSLGKKGQYLN